MPNRNLLKTYKTTTKKLLSTSQKPASYCIEAARQILQTDSTQSHAYYVYGLALRDRAQPQLEQSKAYIEQARKLNPCFYNAIQNSQENVLKFIKNTCTQLQKYMQEANFLEKRWYDILTMFAKKKDFNSCKVFMKVFEAEKKKIDLSAQQLSTLGLVSYEAGSYVQSARYYRQAINLKPGQYKYYNNLSILSLILKNPTQTVQLITKSLQLKPGYPKSSFLLSFSLCSQKQYEQALSLAMIATNDNPKSIMFRLKVLTILLEYFSQRHDQIQIHLKQIQSTILNSEDGDSYFFIKDNIDVVNVFLMGVKLGVSLFGGLEDGGVGGCWRRFIQCMNQFLLKGHFDKYWLGIQIKELNTKINDYYNKKQQQKAKEQLMNSQKKEQGIQAVIESTEKKQSNNLAEVVEVAEVTKVAEVVKVAEIAEVAEVVEVAEVGEASN